MRIKIARKESKETRYWLRLIDTRNDAHIVQERDDILQECEELTKILSAILKKTE